MRKRMIVLSGILLLLLSGCGVKADQSTVSIDKKGRVTAITVENFDQSYYNAEELEETVNQAVNQYNSGHRRERIELKKCDLKEKEEKVYVTLKYASCEDYADFNQRILYHGTVAEAQKTYDFDDTFLNSEGKEVNTKQMLADNGSAQVLVLEEPVVVATPRPILYTSYNVKLLKEKQAKVKDDGSRDNENADTSILGYAYIIYESE